MKTSLIDGIPVEDAKQPLKVTVTKRDIKSANLKEPSNCAVARACRRELKSEVRVHLGRVYVRSGKSWMRYLTPPAMRNEIIAFDRGGVFEPGEFILKPMPPTKRLGQSTGGNRPANKSKKRRSYHLLTNVRASPA